MKQNTNIIVIKARREVKEKIKVLTELLNKDIAIGRVYQLDAIDYAIDYAIKSLQNG